MILNAFLNSHTQDAALAELIDTLVVACKDIAHHVRVGDSLGNAGQENVQGEAQKKLDVLSNDILKDALTQTASVRGVASEEEPLPVGANDDGRFLVLFDPLDGSSNIDVNVTVGTIFSVLEAKDVTSGDDERAYLQSGREQLAAGYVLYGPSTVLVLTLGKGVFSFTLNPNDGEFYLQRSSINVPNATAEFAINMSNQRFWQGPMQAYVNDLLQGEEGPLGKRFNMRWIASMVAEIHRIMTRGGIFMYPFDHRDPKKPGKLRLMYEANPMALLVEQAGGHSSTATQAILDIEPEHIHQRVPVIMGSHEEVSNVERYHSAN